MLDPKNPMYKSAFSGNVFPHRIVLEKIVRQGEFEQNFKTALDSLRLEICDDESEAYLSYFVKALC